MKSIFNLGYKVQTQVMHGSHCAYVYKADEDGEGILGKVILSFLEKRSFV